MTDPAAAPGRVVVVTGGGSGIGAAVAEELGRTAWFVVTLDPLVSLDGSAQLPAPEETTAGRIAAAGGSARAASVSVTDRAAVAHLFDDLVEEFGRLDAVVNVAGISRPTSFAGGSEEDWLAVLGVHLDGYRNVLEAALPHMVAAGRGHILGVTSGAGWRAADAGAYGCAKRAVASLTWQLGRLVPPGVIVNAMSPIAVTRMVTAALERAGGSNRGASAASGGLALGSMPAPDELGPFVAHLVDDDFSWCRGQVFFAGGSEVAVIDEPRLLEVVRTDDVAVLPQVLERASVDAFVPAENKQLTSGGTNPRFADAFDQTPPVVLPASSVETCLLVTGRPELGAAIGAALAARGVTCEVVEPDPRATFGDATAALVSAVDRTGPLDAVVVALADAASTGGPANEWERVLADHIDIVGQLHTDAGWARAAADFSRDADRPVRLVTLTDATNAGGVSRAQASAQLSRAARNATDARIAAFAVSLETASPSDDAPIGELVAHLLCSPDAPSLSGAELVVGNGWIGLRNHPRPGGSVSLGGPGIPDWLDDALREIVRVPAAGVHDRPVSPRPGKT